MFYCQRILFPVVLLFILLQPTIPNSLSTRSNQFHIFNLFFDYLEEIQAYAIDQSRISFFTKSKQALVISFNPFDFNLQLNLSTLATLENSNKYRCSFKYPKGLFAIDSTYFLFEILSDKKRLYSFIDKNIREVKFLDQEKVAIWREEGSELKIYNISNFDDNFTNEIAEGSGYKINKIRDCPVQILRIFNENKTINENSDSFYESLEDRVKVMGSNDSVIDNQSDILIDSSFIANNTDYYIFNTLNQKIRKVKNPLILRYIYETIQKSFEGCMLEPGYDEDFEIDFEIDDSYFLMSCKDEVFIFAFSSTVHGNFSINHIYYRNLIERMFIFTTSIRIIESNKVNLIYSIFSNDAVCYYIYEPYHSDFKYFSNKRILCMKNTVISAYIEDVNYNSDTKYVSIFMRNNTDDSVFVPSFHKCVLNMHVTTNFICQICNTIYCPKQCERYQYPGCSFIGEVQRTFFVAVTMLIMIAIILLFIAHICKNRENLLFSLISIFHCLYDILKKTLIFSWNIIWNKRCFRRMKYLKSYVIYWCKRGFFRKLEEEAGTCPICLEAINIKPKCFFACGRHEVHLECFNHYIESNNENGKKEVCPFRDV